MDLLSLLPVEISQRILQYLSGRDLGRCCLVSKVWRGLVDSLPLWRGKCHLYGWNDTAFIDQERSHWPANDLGQRPLWKLNKWAENFGLHCTLPNNWASGRSRVYLLSPSQSEVAVFSCDEVQLAVGHKDGWVTVLTVWRLPALRTSFQGFLAAFPVLALQISGRHVVLVQSMLLQIFVEEDATSYRLVDAKSFEKGLSLIEAFAKYQGEVGDFAEWYSQDLSPDKYTKEKISTLIHFQILNDIVYVTVRDYQMIYGWSLNTGQRLQTIHIPNRNCKLRDMVIHNTTIYIIYASRNVRHITAYNLLTETFTFEITTPDFKTQKLIVGQYLIGVAISGPGLTTPGVIKVWDRENGKDFASRRTGIVTYKTVVEFYDLIAYAESRTLYLWDPKNDSILRSFTSGDVISYVMACPYKFLLVVGGGGWGWLWDWMTGSPLYPLHPREVKSGDYRGLIHTDQSMLLLRLESTVIEMRGYC